MNHSLSTSEVYLCLLCALFSACAKTSYVATKVERSTRGMVVSEHPLASDIGRDVLADGGNAVDAAIAVQFALAVVCPRAGNLGGGGFMLAAPHDDAVRTLDYRERAPAGAYRDMYLDGSAVPTHSCPRPARSPLASPEQWTVCASAYTYGSRLRDWSRLVKPAAKLAREGYELSPTEATRLNEFRERFVAENDFAFPFVKQEPWAAGDRLRQMTLATTLDSIAERGPSYFYSGGFAERLSAEVQARGGIWTAEDLQAYGSTFRDPIRIDFDEYAVYSMPPPSSGGVALAQMFGLLDGYDLRDLLTTDTAAYYHLVIEAMRRAYEDRAEFLGDPDFVTVPVDSLDFDDLPPCQVGYVRSRLRNR